MKRRRIDVLCLQETRWMGCKAKEIGERIKLFYYGVETKTNGVAIAVAGTLKEHVLSVNRVSERLISVRIATNEGFWTVISVYAPQCGCPEADEMAFYDELDEAIKSTPESDYLLLLDKIREWQMTLADAELRLNLKKTEIMSSIEEPGDVSDISGTMFTQTKEFQYLGSLLSADGTVGAAVRGRITCAWLKWRESTGILCDRRCSRVLKGKVYRTIVRPALLYGSECWPVSKTHERMLNTAEMRMLRWA
ncbi:hypothetical protein ANCCEY_13583, partial [Ancylostoma ceylanicum]